MPVPVTSPPADGRTAAPCATWKQRWEQLASRVEAYREEWGVEPDQLRDPPIDGVQYRCWRAEVKTVELLAAPEPEIDHGIGLSQSHNLGLSL